MDEDNNLSSLPSAELEEDIDATDTNVDNENEQDIEDDLGGESGNDFNGHEIS